MENKPIVSDKAISLTLIGIYVFIAISAAIILIDPPFLQSITEGNREQEVNYTLKEAMALSQNGNDREAIIKYRKAIEEMPNSAAAHNNAAVSMIKLNLIDEARQSLKKALTMKHADSADIYNNLAIISLKNKDSLGALANFEKSDNANRYMIDKPMKRGIYYMNTANWENSYTFFKKALDYREDMAAYYHDMLIFSCYRYRRDEDEKSRIKAFLEAGNFDLNYYDEELFLSTVRRDYAYAENENKTGFALARIGRYNKALEHFSKALKISPGYKDPRLNTQYILDNKL